MKRWIFLAPLAFVSPRIVSALVEGTLTANIRVTALAKASSTLSWSEQERRLQLESDHSSSIVRVACPIERA